MMPDQLGAKLVLLDDMFQLFSTANRTACGRLRRQRPASDLEGLPRYHLSGGIMAWKAAGLPTQPKKGRKPRPFDVFARVPPIGHAIRQLIRQGQRRRPPDPAVTFPKG